MGFGAGSGGIIPGWAKGKKPDAAKPTMKTVKPTVPVTVCL